MNDIEINTFIERMEEMGDVWEQDDVKRVYGNKSLEEALNVRMADISTFGNIIATVINRNID